MNPDVTGEIDSALRPDAGDELETSLQANQVDPKFLYATPRQAEMWRQVFLRHSPIHTNPEFTRIYRDAFAQVAALSPAREILLAGLGCGTGIKELELYLALKASGCDPLFSAVDISRDLVEQSVARLATAGARHAGSLVCDLADSEIVARWLDGKSAGRPRLMTFFGIVPNLAPARVVELLQRVLRPGDLLLASVHLAPVTEARDLGMAMRSVFPQYDNNETRAWLGAAIEAWGLSSRVDPPEISMGEVERVPAFLGMARRKSGEWLRLFYSLRYTPVLFEEAMRRANLRAERLAITACGEEGIWLISAK